MEKSNYNPMRAEKIKAQSKCGAQTRSGGACKGLAMTNGRCRMHGGTNPGAPKGNQNAWKHGFYSLEMQSERKFAKSLLNGVL